MIILKVDDIFLRHFEVCSKNEDAAILLDGVPHVPKWGPNTMSLFVRDLREAAKEIKHDCRELQNQVDDMRGEVELMAARLNECAGRAEN